MTNIYLTSWMKKTLIAIATQCEQSDEGFCWTADWNKLVEDGQAKTASLNALRVRKLVDDGSTGYCDFVFLTDAGLMLYNDII